VQSKSNATAWMPPRTKPNRAPPPVYETNAEGGCGRPTPGEIQDTNRDDMGPQRSSKVVTKMTSEAIAPTSPPPVRAPHSTGRLTPGRNNQLLARALNRGNDSTAARTR